MKYEIIQHDLKIERPKSIRIFLAQIQWGADDWQCVDGLYFHKYLDKVKDTLQAFLSHAQSLNIDLVIFPELSIPEQLLPFIHSWSEKAGSIVIGGSHYHKKNDKYISRCPIIIGKKIYFTEKITPSYIEVSPIDNLGLQPGQSLLIFNNSSIGNFCVLICSDFVDPDIKNKLPFNDLDLICVPAFQRESEYYYSRMNIDCEQSINGLYIAYANTCCSDIGDGSSALFGLMDRVYLQKLKTEGLTDLNPQCKIVALKKGNAAIMAEIDLKYKKPYVKHTVNTRPNVGKISIFTSQGQGPLLSLDTQKISYGHESPLLQEFSQSYLERFPKKENLNCFNWDNLIEASKKQVMDEIRSKVGKKYILNLYIHRKIEGIFESFLEFDANLQKDFINLPQKLYEISLREGKEPFIRKHLQEIERILSQQEKLLKEDFKKILQLEKFKKELWMLTISLLIRYCHN